MGRKAASGRVLLPPARSWFLRAYASIIPASTRQALRARLSPRLWSFLARRLTEGSRLSRLVDAMLVRFAQVRYAAFLADGRFSLVKAEHGFVPAIVDATATPTAARRRTLDTVAALLGEAAVPFFCVRGFDDHTSVVAVPAPHRATALAALRGAGRRLPLYVAVVSGSRVGRLRAGRRSRMWRRLRSRWTLRITLHVADPTGALVLGASNGCDIEFWREDTGVLHAPRPNRVTDTVPGASPVVMAPESTFTRVITPHTRSAREYPTREEMTGELLDDITFPVDVVYTWVDGADPVWRARRDASLARVAGDLNPQSANESRYVSRDELRYSFRSVYAFAPWIRRIWLVVDDQIPSWLDTGHDQVSVVTHKELFGGRGALPTFNSHAIESQLHHIDGLAEHFVYLNDDVFLGRPLAPQTFFEPNGLSKVYRSTAKVDAGPVDAVADTPSTAAAKNNRELIMGRFGRRVTFKMKHAPEALRRSVLAEIEQEFADALDRTSRHQFRHPGDVSLTSSLYQYYSFLNGRALLGDISYMYLDLSAPETPAVLRLALASRRFDVFCINDTDSDADALAKQRTFVHDFLGSYFPVAAPWEKG